MSSLLSAKAFYICYQTLKKNSKSISSYIRVTHTLIYITNFILSNRNDLRRNVLIQYKLLVLVHRIYTIHPICATISIR